MLYNTEHDGVRVTSLSPLSEYMPPLAVALYRTIGVRDGETTHLFVADFLKMLEGTPRPDIFPDDMKRMAREMRIFRLLATPVQVADAVMSLETLPKRRMYDKTKRLVLRRGVLTDPAGDPPRATAPLPSIAPEVRALSDNGVSARDALPVDLPALKALVSAEVETRLALDGLPPADERFTDLRNDLRDLKWALNEVRQKIGLEPQP